MRDVGGCVLRAFGPFGMKDVRQDNATGHPEYPLSHDELPAKFRANPRVAEVGETATDKIADDIQAIDRLDDIGPLPEAIARAVVT